MTVYATSLASGSSGNALLVQTDTTALLVDCGLPQRTIEKHLAHVGIAPADLSAILLTHEHGDHAHSAGPLARRYNIPIITNVPTTNALGVALAGVMPRMLDVGATTHIGDCQIQSFPIPHDAAAPVGYTIHAEGWCVGVATDLGSWDAIVLESLQPADLVVIEANHDLEKLRMAPYQWPVKQRIFSPLGHLDNIETGNLLARLGDNGRCRTAWLAHLSEQANSPDIARKVIQNVLALAEVSCIRVAVLPRRAPLHWASDEHLQQLEFF
ncbi:MAG: MBL fold metallo-hydrolase [Chloroflexi bacterium AL-N1]|nr:MBL fold metallo-hydrolase [Chloroflexi bacterium AL-N1]NOK77294.1 MBL fold metallo-hydrolase [Chloroflexi bacterium AL-N5]